MATTANLGLTLLDPGQNQKEVTINQGLTSLDTLLGAFVTANNNKLLYMASGNSAALGLASVFTISGGNLTLANQNANLVLAGPASGGAATPTYRALVPKDAPVAPAVVALTDAATIATDASQGNHYRVTLGGNRTLGNPTNPTDGQRSTWELIQDGSGSRTIALDSKFALGTDIAAVVLTTTASKRDFLTAIYNQAADKWFVVSFVKGY